MNLWTSEHQDQLKSMRRDGLSHKHIARVLGRTPRAVMTKAEELGVVKGRGKTPPIPRPQPTCTTILKSDLAAYYAVGWRVIWFEGNQVGVARAF